MVTCAPPRASSPSIAETTQEVLARPFPHRRDLPPHQRVQGQRGRGDPAAAHGRLLRRHRAHQHRAVDQNKLALCAPLSDLLGRPAAAYGDANPTRPSCRSATAARRPDYVGAVRRRWQWLLDNLDLPLAEPRRVRRITASRAGELTNKAANPTLFHRLQDYSLRVPWKHRTAPLPRARFRRRRSPDRERLEASTRKSCGPRVCRPAHARRRRQRVHQHPGQPDNYEMLQTANKAVERIMHLARGLTA